MLNQPRDLERALADLIERRKNNMLTPDERKLIDRMIVDLEAEIRRRRERQSAPIYAADRCAVVRARAFSAWRARERAAGFAAPFVVARSKPNPFRPRARPACRMAPAPPSPAFRTAGCRRMLYLSA